MWTLGGIRVMLRKKSHHPFPNFLAFTVTPFYKNNFLHSHSHFSTKIISLCIYIYIYIYTHIYPYLYKVISITLKEDICSNYFERVWRRNRIESCLSFKVWTHGFDKRDLREFLALSLREKESKVSWNFRFVCLPVGTREGDGFLDVLFVWESQGRGEVELGDCMSKSWSLGLFTWMKLWLYMRWISIDCMWMEFPL